MALRDAERASLAYFYFDFRNVDKQKLHDLLPSLLIQLSARSDPCCGILSKLYTAHDRGVQKPSDQSMIECLKEVFSLGAQLPIYVTSFVRSNQRMRRWRDEDKDLVIKIVSEKADGM